MKIRRTMFAALAALTLMVVPSGGASAKDAEAGPTCTQQYLLCLNVASQEKGAFWRTLMEMECGAEYAGCIRSKVVGA